MIDKSIKAEVRNELTGNILRFWADNMVDPEGGFYGQRLSDGKLVQGAPKGLILNARILWTFSSAYRITGNPEYRKMADRARDEVTGKFMDRTFGGAYWSLDSKGEPLDTKKQFYAIAFAIYGLAEHYRATKDDASLKAAIELYRSIEAHSFDGERNGYIEACRRDWSPIEDMRLSEKDRNDAKTMNSHLHILEGYTSLYRVWKDDGLKKQLENLIVLFIEKITGPDGHLQLFFDEDWNLHGNIRSYGHDIEASWLMTEAAQVLGVPAITERTEAVCKKIAMAAMEGFRSDGGLIYEHEDTCRDHDDIPDTASPGLPSGSTETVQKRNEWRNPTQAGLTDTDCHPWVRDERRNPPQGRTDTDCHPWVRDERQNSSQIQEQAGRTDTDCHWWVQAECVVGCWNQWQLTGDEIWKERAELSWEFIKKNIIRPEGEWWWRWPHHDEDDLAGFWKCPYHNGRMCMELMERIR